MIRFDPQALTLRVFNFSVNLRSSLPYLAALTLIWGVMIAFVNPVGEFPFSDDWMYARTVFELVTKGHYVLNDFQAVTILAQILWASFFSVLFGFSMTTLRFSVIVIGWGGILAAYGLFRENRAGRLLSFLGALVFATTPFFVLFANTFMTDVPFVSLTVASFYFLTRWIQRNQLQDLAVGIILACVTSLVRQLALVIPLAFLVTYLIKDGLRPRSFAVTLLTLGAVAGTLFLYENWLKATIGLPVMYVEKKNVFRVVMAFDAAMKQKLFMAIFYRLTVVLTYLGIFVFPLLLLTFKAQWRLLSALEKRISCVTAGLYAAAVTFFLLNMKLVMPIGVDQLFNLGLGAEHIDGSTMSPVKYYAGQAPFAFWLVLTAAGVLGSSALIGQVGVFVFRFFRDLVLRRGVEKHWPSVLFLSLFSIHFLPFGLSGHFDRYQLFYMPFLVFWILRLSGPARFEEYKPLLPVFLVLVMLMTFFSVGATRDCMMRNRVRWHVLRHLMSQGIPATQIDGGYEFNGWYTYDKNYQKRPDMNWWWVKDDKYRVSYSPFASGYKLLTQVNYDRWVPPGRSSLYVLERIAETREPYRGQTRSVYEM